MNLRHVGALVAAIGCGACGLSDFGSSLGECLGGAVGFAVGNAIGESLSDSWGGRLDGPDVGARQADAGTFLSVVHGQGRLELRFQGGLFDGDLPRLGARCVTTDWARFRPADGGDALPVLLSLSETGETPVDGGIRLEASCTAIRVGLSDGGFEPLEDRRIDVIAR